MASLESLLTRSLSAQTMSGRVVDDGCEALHIVFSPTITFNTTTGLYTPDATATSVVITDIDYSSLSTPLSKMIFLYLDLQQNNNYINYDNEDLVSSVSSTLECCYEVFLVETMFNYIAINTIY